MNSPVNPTSDSTAISRRRIGLAIWLAACWILLAIGREMIFYCFGSEIDPRWSDFFFGNQVGLVHAMLLALAAVIFFSSRRVSRWMFVGGVIAMSLTILLARAGYLYYLYESTQSMVIRTVVFLLVAAVVASRNRIGTTRSKATAFHFSIVDGLMLTLVLATFMGAIRDVLWRYPKLWRDDLVMANRDYAALVFFGTESIVESAIGFTWFAMLRHRVRWTLALPFLVGATFLGSVICTLAFKSYEWYQFEYPVQLKFITDYFQIAFPKLIAFAVWLLLFGTVLQWIGLLRDLHSDFRSEI